MRAAPEDRMAQRGGEVVVFANQAGSTPNVAQAS